ncbi:MAG: glycoside hydrolase family 3 protein [Lachnospiraceae bacterium]|nr:glycoside hydrolase family 3 protein [Lachnospiraceae bacterium]
MKNKYRLLIFAGCIAVVLSRCSLFYAKNQSPDLTSANERIETDKNTVEDQTLSEDVGETNVNSFSEEAESPNLSENTEKNSEESAKEGSSLETAEETVSSESPESNPLLDNEVQTILDNMTLEDKIAQLFILYPETLVSGVNRVTAAGEMTREAFDRRPVGGLIYMRQNLESREQVQTMLSDFQEISLSRTGLPAFLCVDEEGGKVTSVGGTEALAIPRGEDMADIGARNHPEEAYQKGEFIGGYLSELGFNVDFAPVADVLSNPENTVVKKRSFGADPKLVTAMTAAFAEGLQSKGILGSYKHFPGHGATAGDTHKGYSYTDKTLEELKACELLPFIDGISRDIPMIMVGHISLPKVIGDDTPASLSSYIMTDLLREELGYKGIIVTDALAMKAVIDEYSSDEAAVRALEAGADILLLPEDFELAFQGVLQAVNEGRLSRERLDQSLQRIIRQKLWLKEQAAENPKPEAAVIREGEEAANIGEGETDGE